MNLIIMKLDALTCPSCLQKIDHALNQAEGVTSTKTLFNAVKVKVVADLSVTSTDVLEKIITNLGYQVQSIKVKEAV